MRKNGKNNEAPDSGIISEIEKRFERHTGILMEQAKHEVNRRWVR